jgi:hypothetical protein
MTATSDGAQGGRRSGRYAVYRGEAYRYWVDPADSSIVGLIPEPDGPVPADLAEGGAPGSGAPGYLVSRRGLDAMYESRWYFDWHGGEFEVVGELGTEALSGNLVTYSDDFVKENGLTVYERFVAGGTFPVEEIQNLREERTDLLAAWKAKHGVSER